MPRPDPTRVSPATNILHRPIDKQFHQNLHPRFQDFQKASLSQPIPSKRATHRHDDHPVGTAAAEQLEGGPPTVPPAEAAPHPRRIPNHGYRDDAYAARGRFCTTAAGRDPDAEAYIPYVPLLCATIFYVGVREGQGIKDNRTNPHRHHKIAPPAQAHPQRLRRVPAAALVAQGAPLAAGLLPRAADRAARPHGRARRALQQGQPGRREAGGRAAGEHAQGRRGAVRGRVPVDPARRRRHRRAAAQRRRQGPRRDVVQGLLAQRRRHRDRLAPPQARA